MARTRHYLVPDRNRDRNPNPNLDLDLDLNRLMENGLGLRLRLGSEASLNLASLTPPPCPIVHRSRRPLSSTDSFPTGGR